MYISRLILKTDGLSPSHVLRVLGGDDYQMHQSMWRLFDGDSAKKRHFLYRRDDLRRTPTFLLLSRNEPNDQHGIWSIETKLYHPLIREGESLAFSLRINPIIARRDEDGKQHRHDVVMDRKWKVAQEGSLDSEVPHEAELVRQSAWSWLSQRMHRLGFVLTESAFHAEAYHQHRLTKRNRPAIQISTVDCRGILTVRNVEQFERSLMQGIGPAKAFGCGLLLVKRVYA